MLVTADGHAVEASYIEGFGVLLRMRVGFPLMAPKGGESPPPAAQPTSEWEEARRALAGGEGLEATGGTISGNSTNLTVVLAGGEGLEVTGGKHLRAPAGKRLLVRTRGEAERYDPEWVETLKRRALALLRNGSHLRHLKANEWLAVSITGRPALASRRQWQVTGAARADVVVEVEDSSNLNRATMLTLRVKKADADALAAGKISEEQFAKQAEVETYLGAAPPDGTVVVLDTIDGPAASDWGKSKLR
jgi:hypothetical protein